MRKAYNDVQFVIEDGKFIGVSLGYDFCAEHEWGNKGMRRNLGIPDKGMGIETRQITKHDCVVMKENKTHTMITSLRGWNMEKQRELPLEKLLPYDMGNYDTDKELRTAWSEEGFCILVNHSKHPHTKAYMEQLWEAFQKNDIAIAYFAAAPFGNAPLSVLIVSQLPQEALDGMYAVDKKAHDLVDYEKSIGLYDLKEKQKALFRETSGQKGKNWMACSPRWIDYENPKERQERKEKIGTKYDIQYWLNYPDYNMPGRGLKQEFGWFIVEQVKEWLETPGITLVSLNEKYKKSETV